MEAVYVALKIVWVHLFSCFINIFFFQFQKPFSFKWFADFAILSLKYVMYL